MATVDVINALGEKVSQIELSDNIFNIDVNGSIIYDIVKMQLASRRSGTASVKNRSDIKGSTRKLYRQKGTGNARPGDIKSPLRRGGGVIFGPHPRAFTYNIPKKIKKLALKMALSSKYQNGKLHVIDKIDLNEYRTKNITQIFQNLNLNKTLLIIPEKNEYIEKSINNIKNSKTLRTEGLNVYDILKYDNLLIIENALTKIEGRFNV